MKNRIQNEFREFRFGDLIEITNGQVSPLARPYADQPHIGPENIESGSGRILNPRTARQLGLKSGKYPFDENCIIYSKVRPALNKVCTPDFTGICSADAYPIRVRPGTDKDFLAHLMRSPWFVKEASARSMRTGMPKINRPELESLKVILPNLPTQRRIAKILGTSDHAIRSLQTLIAAKTDRKRCLLQELLTGEKRLPGSRGKWEDVKLAKLLKHVFRPVEWSPDETYHLVSIRRRSGGLFRREPVLGSEYKTRDLHVIHDGDFLISKRQVSHGALAMVRPGFHGCHVSKEYTILENRDPERLYMPLFDWLSRTRRMWWLAHVVSSGVALEKLIFAPKDFLKFSIKLPPSLEEQEEIVRVLDTCDRELDLHRQQLEALREQKRGLMQKLLTGEIRVKPD